MNAEQKADVVNTFGEGWKNVGNLDYVCCWYKKAADLMTGKSVRTALVSTNSVCQGESVAVLWGPLFAEGVHIDFGYRTFIWDSEATDKAHVHCVIVGFSKAVNIKPRIIYDGPERAVAENINAYLVDAVNVFIIGRNKSLSKVPAIGIGNMPVDNNQYLFDEREKEEFVKKEPAAEKYFHLWYGSREFINRSPRYCLWLGECTPAELKKMPECMKRIQAVHDFRASSKRAATAKAADKPTRFMTENMPKSNYIVVPKVSSERRRYIPMGFFTPDIMCSDLVFLIPEATLYHFGILESNVHMSWMRAVCGRLKSDYRYSKDIVYNNFPWPNSTPEQKEKIEKTAQGILDARDLYPDSSLADLYDPLTMPPELRKAHQLNDKAVMQAYGMPIKETDEAACVAWLMRLYQEKVNEIKS